MTVFTHPIILHGRLVLFSAALAILIPTTVLVGWAFDLPTIKSILPGFPEMKPVTAIAFLIVGFGLLNAALFRNSPAGRPVGILIGLVVSSVGVFVLSSYIIDLPTFVDNLFVGPDKIVEGSLGHRMSPHSAVSFVLVGLSLASLDAKGKWGSISAFCGLASLVLTYAAILGLLYHATQFYGVSRVNGMAIHTAFVFVAVSIALISANSRYKLVETILADDLGGQTARRLLPCVVAIPTLFGWLRVKGQDLGLYDTWFGLAMTIFVSVTSMVFIILLYSRRLHRLDQERQRVEAELTEKEMRYRELFDHGQGLICIHDVFGNLTSVNPAVLASLGYSRDEMEGKNLRAFLPEEHRVGIDSFLRQIENEGLSSGLLPILAKDGKQLMWRYKSILVSDPNRDPYIIGHAVDVSELMAAQSQLRALSLNDDLTGLYNRRGFLTLAEQQIKLEMHNGTARGLTLLFADMDGLKAINDTYGHEAGSTAIKTLARLIKSVVRSADVVARWGGDEFVILSIGARNENRQQMIDRVYEALDEYNAESREPYLIACSIGTTPINANDPRAFDEIITAADEEMYAEKRRRKVVRGDVDVLAQPKDNSDGNPMRRT